MRLHSEAAADIDRDHADAGLRPVEVLGKGGPQQVRHLGRGVEGQVVAAAVVDGEGAARLHRHAGDARGAELGGEDAAGGLPGRLEALGPVGLAKRHVVADLGMDEVGVRRQRRLKADQGIEDLVVDVDPLERILGHIGVLGQHHRDRVADETRPVGRHQRPLGDLVVRDVVVGDQVPSHARDLGAVEHRDHARHLERARAVDAPDQGVRVRAAHEGEVQGVRRLGNVVDVGAPAAQQALVLDPRNRLPDVAELVVHGRFVFKFAAADRTARTMFT